MVDIELRWFIKKTRSGQTEQKLQYRQKKGPRGEDWWGEWEYVPMVYEYEDEAD